MKRTTYYIPGMDCPSEERLIRMKLEPLGGLELRFDLVARTLVVLHPEELSNPIEVALSSLGLGAKRTSSIKDDSHDIHIDHKIGQHRALITVLGINFVFFLIEILAGLVADSMGLVADSLDMLADALVYGLSLMAISMTAVAQRRVARFSGYTQIVLAIIGLIEVVRRFLGLEVMPEFGTMIGISLVALVANATCLIFLQRTQSHEAHIRASIIFSANDILINIGVILSGGLVYLLESRYPDLIVGILIFILVMQGAQKILALAS